MATTCGMTGAQQAASGYALSALLRIKNLHHFLGHYPWTDCHRQTIHESSRFMGPEQ
jgi:hypothetical protein